MPMTAAEAMEACAKICDEEAIALFRLADASTKAEYPIMAKELAIRAGVARSCAAIIRERAKEIEDEAD